MMPMIRRIAKKATGRTVMVTVGAMLAVAGLMALPVVPASATTSSVISYWGASHFEDSGGSYACGTTWEVSQGQNAVDEVYNPCDARVWVHYYSDNSSVPQTYCISPGGGLAYDIPLDWSSSVTFANIQLTSNTSQCDPGSPVGLAWEDADTSQIHSENDPCAYFTETITGDFIEEAVNSGCDTRMWLHYSASGGASYCINPLGLLYQPPADAYWQVQVTSVQAPCSAGGAPYPY
jgi:hypothetical protein